jgi:hypothetical protein
MPIETVLRRTKFDRIVADLRRGLPVRISRTALVAACLCVVGFVGYIDYVSGYERPLLLFYLVPISLATWFASLRIGLVIAVISRWLAHPAFLSCPQPAMAVFSARLFSRVTGAGWIRIGVASIDYRGGYI